MSIKKEEFNEKIFTRINDLINEYELIKEGEKIAIALSGGKDSVLTLHALKNYHDICGFDFELVAISVDEGIEGYRQHGIDAAVNNAKLLDIPLIQKSFKDEEGFALDDIYSYFKSACIPCGAFQEGIQLSSLNSVQSLIKFMKSWFQELSHYGILQKKRLACGLS